MDLRIAKILFLIWCATVAKGMQQFDKEPQYTESNPGDTVVMQCRVFNKKGQCVWQKDGKPVGIYPGKYEWVGSPELGDCSIRITAARADFDAGEWECQVTASSFDAQDALTSNPAWLVIRVAPSPPQIEVDLTNINYNANFTVTSGKSVAVRCISRGGNPAANLKWFLGNRELIHHNQTNVTDLGKIKTWMAISTLWYTFNKSDHLSTLKCVAVHEAYPTKSRDMPVTLDVHYAPEVSLSGLPSKDLEENTDNVSLRCVADANPPATVIWRRIGGSNLNGPTTNDIYSFQETIEFSPVNRKDAAKYSCEAKNVIGTSNLVTVPLDVKYPPVVINVGPAVGHQLTVSLYESARLECQADGNPSPRYQWIQRILQNGEEIITIKSQDRYTSVSNVTYEDQGDYICTITNVINGQERTVNSDPVNVRVVGPPQMLRESSSRYLSTERGDDAVLRATFCADPRPLKVSWRWGSFQLEAGTGSGRFVAEALHKGKMDECYEARLRIQRVEMNDARHYYLTVENEKGSDSLYVTLAVKEPVSMATVIAVVIACLFLIIVVTLCLLYAYRSERCCFNRNNGSKSTDLESMKSDVESVRSSNCSNGSKGTYDSGQSNKKTKSGKSINPCSANHKNPADYGGLLYADLQLPKTSNNGSMKLKSSHWNVNTSHLSEKSFDQSIDTLDTTLDRSHCKVDI